jgi:hypothetical protein
MTPDFDVVILSRTYTPSRPSDRVAAARCNFGVSAHRVHGFGRFNVQNYEDRSLTQR